MTRAARAARRWRTIGVAAFAVVVALGPSAASAGPYSPSVNYALHCQGCHLADGSETKGLVPAIDGTMGRFMRLREGRDYLLRLPNVAATQLDDADTAALLNWLLHRFAERDLPADFAPFTPAEVAAGRHAPLVDVEGARRDVLRRLGEAPADVAPQG